MNKSVISILLAVTLVFLLAPGAYAILHPHDYLCTDCHAAFGPTTNSQGMNAACLGCHNPTGVASRMPIETRDMSNRFGRSTNVPSGGSQSSHNWRATDNFPPVASPPNDPRIHGQ